MLYQWTMGSNTNSHGRQFSLVIAHKSQSNEDNINHNKSQGVFTG